MPEIAVGAPGMRRFELREPLRDLRQTARNLVENLAEETIRLLRFGSDLDRPKKCIRGVFEAPQSIIGYTKRQFELCAFRQPFAPFLDNRDSFRELLPIQQRL